MSDNAKKRRRFLLGEGYPWYHRVKGFDGQEMGYYEMSLASGPNHTEGRKCIPLKLKWGAWQKVRIWIEKA